MRDFKNMLKRMSKRFGAGMLILMLLIGLMQPVTAQAAVRGTYYIKINRIQNCVTVYKQDSKGNYTVPVKAMVCSTGANKATPLGKFRIGGKYRWHELDGPVYGQYCSRITGHVLFHSVYYSTTDPSTLSYNAYNRLGTMASHGCVRLSVADAKWIYDNCASGTTVEIYDSSDPGPLGKPEPVKIDVNSRYRGWDPTDPAPNNPWKKVKPVIKGASNKTVERCAKVDLKKGVSAKDYLGKSLKVKVSGKCNTKKPGKYKITYTAVGANKLTTTKTITITVKDTKKPKVTIFEKKLELTEQISENALKKLLLANLEVTDNGEALANKYVTLSYTELSEALSENIYGTYNVTVYAKDKYGNKSAKKTFKVAYINPNPEEPEPDPEQPDVGDSGDTGTEAPGTGDTGSETPEIGDTGTEIPGTGETGTTAPDSEATDNVAGTIAM